MKSYYIRHENKPQGPYSINQLKEIKLNPAVLVWAEGLKEWMTAIEIPELQQALFPEPSQSVSNYSETGIEYSESAMEETAVAPAKNWKTVLAVLGLIIATFLLLKLQKPESQPAALKTVSPPAKTLTQIKKDPRQKELENPAAYIKGEISWRKNLVGTTILEGSLHNTATLVNFRDPVIMVTWVSNTNTTIGTNRYIVNKYLAAGQTISYKLKVSAPSKIADVRVSVESATPIQ